VGNSGAGKSTLGKILTVSDDTELTSIPAGDRFIIKDREGRISGRTTTVISKSVFPKLLVNSVTGEAFYDLPGFGDTRGPAVEIGNADFMKRVGERASRVKVLIVLNYSSLKSGETRTDFRNLLESLLDYLPNLGESKFKPGVALVANKVDPEMKTELVLPAIAQFLKNAQASLPTIFAKDQGRLRSLTALINLLLTKDKKGTGYARLGFFKTPDREGPLSGVPSVQAARTVLNRILSANTQFVTKSPTDFGLSMTPSTRLFIAKAITNIHRNVAQVVEEIAGVIRKHFDEKGALPVTLENTLSFRSDWMNLKKETERLVETGRTSATGENSGWVETIPDILSNLAQQLQLRSDLEAEISDEIEKLRKYLKNLAFLEPFHFGGGRKARTPKLELGARSLDGAVNWWATPLLSLSRDTEATFHNLGQELSQGLSGTYQEVTRDIQVVYRENLAELYEALEEAIDMEEVNKYEEVMKEDLEELTGLTKRLDGLTTSGNLSSFVNETIQTLTNLGIGVSSDSFEGLQEFMTNQDIDISLGDWTDRPTPFTPAQWLNSLDKMGASVGNEIQNLQSYIREKEYEAAKGGAEENEEEDDLAEFEQLKAKATEEVDQAEAALLKVRAEMEALVEREREIVENNAAQLSLT